MKKQKQEQETSQKSPSNSVHRDTQQWDNCLFNSFPDDKLKQTEPYIPLTKTLSVLS